MKILLMGGTGALGSSLSPYLAEDHNNEIYITSRRKNKDRENIHYILCDAKNIEEIDCLLRNNRFDIVVDFINNKVFYKHKSNNYKYTLEPDRRTSEQWTSLLDELQKALNSRIDRG